MKKLSGIAAALLIVMGSSALASVTTDVVTMPKLAQLDQHFTASKRVAAIFTRGHYLQVKIDDELSAKVFERYLDSLDYYHNVMLKSDIDAFAQYKFQFDDAIQKGQFDFAFQMFNLSLQRRAERFDYAISLLEKPFDFTAPDSYEYEREDAPWATDLAQLNELWRQRVKFDALNLKLTGKKPEEIKELLLKRYKSAKKRLAQTESEDVFQLVLNSYARSIEAHTSYLSPRNADRFQQEMNLSLEGIGAVLQLDDDYTVIASLVPGGPADMTKKLKPKDKIVGVAQGSEEFVDIVGWRLDDVVDLIKGPKGSKVRLQVMAASDIAGTAPQQIEIVRDKIRLEDRAAKGEVFKSLLHENGKNIGVINIPSFYNNLTEDVKKELTALKEKKVDGIIVDLRGNGGGSLPEAITLTGLFIDKGPVVQIREGNGRIMQNDDTDASVFYEGPLTVMVDRYSASASEIFAAALQDYGRAVIIGENTFGKGTVQQHRGLGRIYDTFDGELGSVQYTIAKFYRINGGSTQHKGVIPDIIFPSPIDPAEWGESKEKNALPWDSIPAAAYASTPDLKVTLPLLTEKHQKRIAAEPEFNFLMQDIADYKREKDVKTISLNEKERLAKKDELAAKELARTNERLARLKLPTVKKVEDAPETLEKLDPFLEEAALITADLIMSNRLAKK
ncbi:carboxy terminal-processing peptidase [Rheinheimera riviphila]|uniref:Carboxy terminal-processing peptidase n=1 Tax=Rheinheimera riviphila TaxID=1834037 RepID=A0A437R256_9GAMM|nr:carboxy terminal-processing peptidase [Rheinheimera riviphila]RVU40840.1 carboxy terminal-processing peptidase [Rheinheimera riviphila]